MVLPSTRICPVCGYELDTVVKPVTLEDGSGVIIRIPPSSKCPRCQQVNSTRIRMLEPGQVILCRP